MVITPMSSIVTLGSRLGCTKLFVVLFACLGVLSMDTSSHNMILKIMLLFLKTVS